MVILRKRNIFKLALLLDRSPRRNARIKLVYKMKVQLVYILLTHLFINAHAYTTCEENQLCYFKSTVSESSNRIKTLQWKTNVYIVSICNLGDPCTTYANFRDYATPSVDSNVNNVSFSMTLSNVNRKRLQSDGYVWKAIAFFSDGSSKIFFDTTLQIIVKPKQLTCAYNTSVNGLLIDCLGSKSYPESKCNFTLKFNEVDIGINNTPEYNHTKLFENDEYFLTRCSLNIPMQNITTGHYEFDIRIYPGSSDSECEDCGNTTITLDIEKPKVQLIRCSSYVFEGTRLDCTCRKSDSSDLASQVTWYQGNSILQEGENISVLTTTVSMAQNYTCLSENAFGWRSNSEIYIPNIINDKPYSCLPQGICYGNVEFCYNGQVESCFSFNLSSVTFKKWCETQGHLKRNGSSNLACDTHFDLREEEGRRILISIVVAVIVVLIIFIIICWKKKLITKKLFKSRKKKQSRNEHCESQAYPSSANVLELELFLPRSTGSKVPTPHKSGKHSQICIKTFSTRGDEEDIHFAKKEWDICKRKSKHKGLILCTEYLKNPKAYLPEYDQETVKTYINTCINLTVRLVVKLVSTKRPVNAFGAQKDHALTGSGIIVAVEHTETYHHVEHHDQTEKQTWSVYIATATQVVFDQTEAECTIAELFYDDEQKSRVKKLQAIGIHQYNKNESCIIHCITDEENVYSSLKETLRQQKDLCKDVLCNENKVVLISHPHGMPKHISFGECTEISADSSTPLFKLSRWKYTAATCNGSAGAPVLMLNNWYWQFSKLLIADFHVHSGVNSEGFNFSSKAPITKKIAEKMLSEALQNISYEEVEVNCSEKEVKHKQAHVYEASSTYSADNLCIGLPNCEKNPGHTDFIEVESFSQDHLPDKYREAILYDYIKKLITLTGKVMVNFKSPDRSQFYPTTGDLFKAGAGTGTIVSVVEIKEQVSCPCPDCKNLDVAKKKFYLIFVRTAKHIIFNDEEAHKSNFQINFDKEVSSEINLYGLRLIESEISKERSLVMYVTHDLEVGGKLANTLRQLYTLDKKIVKKFKISDDHKLAVVVSHPHGSFKHVSIGKWLNRKIVLSQDRCYTQYTYTTATCQGCSGAPVFILGERIPRVTKRLLTPHVHKETGDEYNTSCCGIESYRI
ncbi:uncharacterized protein LOC131939945 [Physella acuta]|uniref:uncharacterized protein LOC131939945 n=1 Tax=Physella acuta TaxID=109671 RepID=UPI0027DBBF11|nr:uncharacterized protein LOC131939945 [Physella acuta]